MPLPDFNSNGLLPEGVHPATENDLMERYVMPFETSQTRPIVFEGFQRYRQELAILHLDITQWVDGSFVDRSRLDSEDIDLVNFVQLENIERIPLEDRPKVVSLLGGREATKRDYHCHTFLEIRFPSGHPFADKFEELRKYWRKWWSQPRDYSNPGEKTVDSRRGSKGFVSMTVGSEDNAPRIRTDL